jgi:hypothetical protein
MQLKFCDRLLEKSALKKYRFNSFSNTERFHNSFYHFRFRKNIVNLQKCNILAIESIKQYNNRILN